MPSIEAKLPSRPEGRSPSGTNARSGIARDHRPAPVALSDPGVLRAVVGGRLYLCVLGLFALAIDAIVRHSAAAITGVIGFVLVLSPLAALMPGSIGKHVYAYLPSQAGRLITQAHGAPHDLLSPWQGFGSSAPGPRRSSSPLLFCSNVATPDLLGVFTAADGDPFTLRQTPRGPSKGSRGRTSCATCRGQPTTPALVTSASLSTAAPGPLAAARSAPAAPTRAGH